MKKKGFNNVFDKFAKIVTKATGSSVAFLTAFIIVVIWAILGPKYHYSSTWQLVINTGTTIVTFLMVFVIQQSQNKDTMALQLKLNELIASNKNASNRLIDIEDLTEKELQIVKTFYIQLAELAKTQTKLHETHSYDEALENTNSKKGT